MNGEQDYNDILWDAYEECGLDKVIEIINENNIDLNEFTKLFVMALSSNDVELAKFCMESKDIKNHIDLYKNFYWFYSSVQQDSINVFLYLLNVIKKDVTEEAIAKIYSNIFKTACENKAEKIVNFILQKIELKNEENYFYLSYLINKNKEQEIQDKIKDIKVNEQQVIGVFLNSFFLSSIGCFKVICENYKELIINHKKIMNYAIKEYVENTKGSMEKIQYLIINMNIKKKDISILKKTDLVIVREINNFLELNELNEKLNKSVDSNSKNEKTRKI